MKVALVTPAYNEEEGIGETIERLKKISKKIKEETNVIVVNDGSTDRTVKKAKPYRIKVIDYKKNSGKGAALKKAFKQINADIIAVTDADCTYEVEKIPDMIELLKENNADMVVGSRFLGTIKGGMSRFNWVGNILFSGIVTLITGVKTSDVSSGLRVFRRDAINSLGIQANGLDYEVEMTVRANKKRLKVIEVPIKYNKRVGTSKLNPIRDGWRFLTSIFRGMFV